MVGTTFVVKNCKLYGGYCIYDLLLHLWVIQGHLQGFQTLPSDDLK